MADEYPEDDTLIALAMLVGGLDATAYSPIMECLTWRDALLVTSVKITHLRCLVTVLEIFQLAPHLLACSSKGHGGLCNSRNCDRWILRGVANRYRLVLIGR